MDVAPARSGGARCAAGPDAGACSGGPRGPSQHVDSGLPQTRPARRTSVDLRRFSQAALATQTPEHVFTNHQAR